MTPPWSLLAVPDIDEWQRRYQAKAEAALDAALTTRLRCHHPDCDELGVWFMRGVLNSDGSPIPDNTAWCLMHSIPDGNGTHIDPDRSDALLSMNHFGWLPDGSTWDEGFPKWDEP